MRPIARVLIVDDEPDIRRVGELSLRRVGGWDVALASSGAEAVALAATYHPDLILLDVMMPAMDGPETYQRLRENPDLVEIPIVFVTAKVQREEIARLRALGALGVIAKPFDPMSLPAEIRRIVGEAP